MTKSSEDTGVILALMKRFNEQRLPRTLEIRDKVENGERLGDPDLHFLEQIFGDASHVMPIIDRHPELQPTVSRVISLYKEITEKALQNEKQA